MQVLIRTFGFQMIKKLSDFVSAFGVLTIRIESKSAAKFCKWQRQSHRALHQTLFAKEQKLRVKSSFKFHVPNFCFKLRAIGLPNS